MRAGGAGVAAFYTKIGVGTVVVAEDKEHKISMARPISTRRLGFVAASSASQVASGLWVSTNC